MRKLTNIAFVLEEFSLRTPAQQLLDRFLIGYPRDGEFHRLEQVKVSAHISGNEASNEDLGRREKDFGLVREPNLRDALSGADAVVVVWRGAGATANEALLKSVIQGLRDETPCFVHGALTNSVESTRAIAKLAESKRVPLLAGTPLPVTWRLPDIELRKGTALKEALIVVQGSAPTAEWHGLEGLLPIIERRSGGESGVRSIQSFEGENLWKAGKEGKWSWELLSAAISRSNNPQGDPVSDGRTQDLVGLGLIPKLAREPRGWVFEHGDRLRSSILVLDGVIGDYDFAVQAADGSITSAQLYRPQAPLDHQFSRLAGLVESYFESGKPSWPIERSILIAGLLEQLSKPTARSGQPFETPNLMIRYSF